MYERGSAVESVVLPLGGGGGGDMAAVVQNMVNQKDSRWLMLEVCREFQRNKCTRSDQECKFAHPQPHVEVNNGKVIACFDSIKNRCKREKPPCKYFHPPPHLKDQLLINGRNHLALKQAYLMQSQQLYSPAPYMLQIPGAAPASAYATVPYNPYLPTHQALHAPPPTAATLPQMLHTSAAGDPTIPPPHQQHHHIPSASSAYTVIQPLQIHPSSQPQKQRQDRIEVCREYARAGVCPRGGGGGGCPLAHPPSHVLVYSDGTATICMDAVLGRCSRGQDQCRYFHLLQPPSAPTRPAPPSDIPSPPAADASASTMLAVPSHHASPATASAMTAAHYVDGATGQPIVQPAGKKRARDPNDDFLMALPAGVSYTPAKRAALDKSGIPMYPHYATAAPPHPHLFSAHHPHLAGAHAAISPAQQLHYHQPLPMHQPGFIPVTFAGGHPGAAQRF